MGERARPIYERDMGEEMNREIKFMAWDKRKKRMTKVFGYGKEYMIGGKGIDLNRLIKAEQNTLILLQFAEYQDKTGSDIYDGWIIKTEDGNFEVCFLEGCWYLRRKFDGGVSFGRLNDVWMEIARKQLSFEIIGNIYENPELLGDKK